MVGVGGGSRGRGLTQKWKDLPMFPLVAVD